MSSERDPFSSEAPPPFRSASVPLGLEPGKVVAGKYALVRRLGTGAMGEVWAAKHVSLDEEVAIKLVMRDVVHDDGTTAESRFLLEARAAATLSRKTRHIVNVTDHGEDGPLAYLVMELLAGATLDTYIDRAGPLTLARAVPVVTQLARALEVAHAEGIVHRDLKPSNVFVTVSEEGEQLVKVFDFGIAKLRRSMRRISTPSAVRPTSDQVTLHGMLLGTPSYMSPEQARGRTDVDHRADVWALGVIAYHLLTAAYPFEGETFEKLLERIVRVRATPILMRRPELPQVVGDFFARAFAPSIGSRFQSAGALAAAFEQLAPLAAGATYGQREGSSPSLLPSVLSAGGAMPTLAPNRRAGLARVAGGALVAAVVAATGALVSIHLEREPAHVGAAATVAPVAVATTPAAAERDAIPPPPPVDELAPAVEIDELPAIPVSALPSPARVGSLRPRDGAGSTTDAPAATARAAAPRRALDRSEIF